MKAEEALAAARTYVNQTLVGMGALKGAPCTIKSMTKSGRLTTTVFEWTDANNVKHENTMLVYDGEDGDDGFSPTITVKSSTSTEYILTITDKNGSYDTPNLKGSGGGGGGASALTDLTDVELSSLASGDALVFNGSKWSNVSLAAVATSGDYDDLINKPTIPAAQVQSDWNQSDNTKVDFIKNKPTIPAAQVNADWDAVSGAAQILNKPSIPDPQVQSDWSQSDNTQPDFIQNKPTIPAAQVNADWNAASGVAQILNKPSIPDATTIDSTGTASDTGVRYQRVGIGGVYTEIDGTKYMEQTQTLSTSSATVFTFTNAAITADSDIDPRSSIWGIVPSSVTVSAGSCVVTIPPYSSAVSLKVRIYVR